MGYNVHITRADDWTESEARPITVREWLDYVERDSEMRHDGFAEAPYSGGVLRHESEGIAVWTAYSGHEVNGNMAWFNYHPGEIVVKNPDGEILGKMIRVAAELGATVQGDDGESYDETPDATENSTTIPPSPSGGRSVPGWAIVAVLAALSSLLVLLFALPG